MNSDSDSFQERMDSMTDAEKADMVERAKAFVMESINTNTFRLAHESRELVKRKRAKSRKANKVARKKRRNQRRK